MGLPDRGALFDRRACRSERNPRCRRPSGLHRIRRLPACAVRQAFAAGQARAPAAPQCLPSPSPGYATQSSKGLSPADIDAEGRIAFAPVEREADIEADRAEVGIIAYAGADADPGGKQGEIRPHPWIGAAGIDEGDGAERLEY